jgi:hypothetical protein
MAYSLNLIKTKPECDALLRSAQSEKATLEFRIVGFERQQKNYQARVLELQADEASAQAEIASTTTVIATLPDGNAKEEQLGKRRRAEIRLAIAEDRKAEMGSVSVVEKELELVRVQKELAEVVAFMAQVETRKTELPA